MQTLHFFGLLMSIGICCGEIGDLFVSNGTHILKVNSGSDAKEIVYSSNQNGGRIVGLAVDSKRGLLFWSDIGTSTRGIYKADYHASTWPIQNPTRIVNSESGTLEINSLSLHTVASLVYWTDSRRRTIEVSEYDGSNRRILSINGLSSPRGIYVDQYNGYLFWNDQGSHTMRRSRLDGSSPELMHQNLQWPNDMIVHKYSDSSEYKLYWVDAKDSTLRVSELDGAVPNIVQRLSSYTDCDPIFGVTSSNDVFYVTVWNKGTILRIQRNGQIYVAVSGLGSENIFGVVAMEELTGGESNNPCAQRGCSHLCLPITTNSARCSCPSFGGLALDTDERICRAPSTSAKILFYALADEGEVSFYDTSGARTLDRNIVGKSLRPVAVAYDRQRQIVFWSDVLEQTIHYSKLDGTDHGILLSSSHSLGVVDGLEFDPLNRNLYYAHMGFRTLEGVQYKWHKIEMINVDNRRRVTVVEHAQKPRGLSISGGDLYYTDWGSNAGIYKSKRDGSDFEILWSAMDNPNGVATFRDRVFVTDSHYKKWGDMTKLNGVEKGKVYTWSPDHKTLQQLSGLNVEIPFGITHDKDSSLYVSDWGTKSIIRIIRPGEDSQEVETVIANVGSPMALHISVPSTDPQPCASSCDGVCIIDGSGSQCECSSYDNKAAISTNGEVKCQPVNSWVAVADYNGIRLRSMTAEQQNQTNTVLESDSNIVSLVVDGRNKIYYSDVNKRNVYSAWLNGSNPQLLFSTNDIIDGMAIDVVKGRLYWTDYISGSIRSISTSGEKNSYKILARLLDKPRAIVLKNGYVYWTEWGVKARVGRVSTSGRGFEVLVNSELNRPNALVVEDDKMYIGEANGTLYECNLNGTGLTKLGYMNQGADHIYHMVKHDNWMFYSDWRKGSVSVVDMATGYHRTLMDGLIRPTQIQIKLEQQAEDPCSSNPCSHSCYPLPGNTHYCTCPTGQRITEEGLCGEAPNDWRLAEDSCDSECSTNKTCVQKIGTLRFECHCQQGYEPYLGGCIPCALNTYKPWSGPGRCAECPSSSSNTGTANNGCTCNNGQVWNWMSNSCQDEKPGDCPRSWGLDTCSHSSACESDVECSGAKRCCDSVNCAEDQCVDPVGLDACVHDGNVHHPGSEFYPMPCVRCTCHGVNTKYGNPRYGGAVCTPVECVTPLCQDRVTKDGECCETCKEDNMVIEITNCPEDTVELSVPQHQSYAEYNMNWMTLDYSGKDRKITISDIPSLYLWAGQGVAQSVEVTASVKDELDVINSDTCEFQIKVVDYFKPNVTCPADKEITTLEDTAVVYYDLPLMYEDNVCSDCEVEWSSPPGSELGTGAHTISVTVQDEDLNKDTCSFHVTVTKVSSCPTPEVFNGGFNCTVNGYKRCELVCREGYEPFKVEQVITCADDGWSVEIDNNYRRRACARRHAVVVMGQVVFGNLECTTSGSDQLMGQQMIAIINDSIMRDSTLTGDNINLSSNVIGCSPRKRRRRNAKMELQILLTGVTSPETKDEMTEALDQLANTIRTWAENGMLGDVLGNQQFKVNVIEAEETCGFGRIPQEDYCVECPLGSFDSGSICTDCPSGFYGDRTGQTECVACEYPRTESAVGSISSDMCIIPGTGKPTPPGGEENQLNVALIAGLVGGIGGAAILLLILCCLVCKTEKTANKKYIIQDSPTLDHENKAYDPDTHAPDAEAGYN